MKSIKKCFLVLVFTLMGYVSISVLVAIPVGIATFAVGLKSYALTAGIERYKQIIKKRKNTS